MRVPLPDRRSREGCVVTCPHRVSKRCSTLGRVLFVEKHIGVTSHCGNKYLIPLQHGLSLDGSPIRHSRLLRASVFVIGSASFGSVSLTGN